MNQGWTDQFSSKGREAGFLQEVKINIFVCINITYKSEDCTAESLPHSPLVKTRWNQTCLERSLNQQITISQWKPGTPPLLHPPYTPAQLDNRSSFLMEHPAQAKAKAEAQAELWLPWILPSLCSHPTHAVRAVLALEHGYPNLKSSALGLSKRSPGDQD